MKDFFYLSHTQRNRNEISTVTVMWQTTMSLGHDDRVADVIMHQF